MKTNILELLGCILFGTVLLSGCAKEISEESVCGEGQGVLKIEISLPQQTRSAEEYDPLSFSTLRLYKIERGADNSVSENLIRKYKPATTVPSNLYLAAGEYKITVEAGTNDEATFDRRSYYGEAVFVLEANKSSIVPVVCKIINVAVKVVYDETVAAAFDSGFYTYVSAADEFSLTDAENGYSPTLKFTDSSTGYFLLPEGVQNLSWSFHGESSDPDVDVKGTKTGKIENPVSGMQYTLTFKYSGDAEGFMSVDVLVREYESAHDDNFTFSPQPALAGDGFSLDNTVGFCQEPIKLNVSSINPLSKISFTAGGRSYTVMNAGVPAEITGISYSATDECNGTITLEQSFFELLQPGILSFNFLMYDSDNTEGKATVKIAVPGVVGIVSSDLWYGKAELGAVITDPSVSTVKIKYRLEGENDWNEADAVKSGDGFTYKASATGLTADKVYEIQLVENGAESGDVLKAASSTGTQMPNAGFEDWHKSGNASYPYASGGTEFWGTGNPGSTSMGAEFNLTAEDTDTRPGSSGNYSAKLETKKPSFMGIGKLAAGNIFIGAFGGIQGTGGYVNMGREFTFNARPKALRVWYKYTPAGSDKGRIFVCLVKMTDGSTYHVVNTNSPSQTTFSPDDEFLYENKEDPSTLQGHVIAYGDLMLETVVGNWTMAEIPITYREQYSDEKSNVLMVTASASYRGDYFEGEVGSTMYLDDIEFVY